MSEKENGITGNSQNGNNSNSPAITSAEAIQAAANIAKAAAKAAAQDYVGAAVEVAKSSGTIVKLLFGIIAILLVPIIAIFAALGNMFTPFDGSANNKDGIDEYTVVENAEYLADKGRNALKFIGNSAIKETEEIFNNNIDDFSGRLAKWKNNEEQESGTEFTISKSGNSIIVTLTQGTNTENPIVQKAVFSGDCIYGIYRLNIMTMPFLAQVEDTSASDNSITDLTENGVTTKDGINNMTKWLNKNKKKIMRVETQQDGSSPTITVEAVSWEAIMSMATANVEDMQYFIDMAFMTETFQKDILENAGSDIFGQLAFDINAYVSEQLFGISVYSNEKTMGEITSDVTYNGSFKMPMRMPTISSLFGDRMIFGKYQRHNGLDMYGPANHCEILSIGDGLVTRVGKSSARGLYIVAEYKDNDGKAFYAVYQHLSKAKVRTGDVLKAGQVIGLQGGGGMYCTNECRKNTGSSTGHHLHFEINASPTLSSATAIDPLTILSGEQF